MSVREMFDRNAEVMTEGYSLGRIFKRTIQAFRYRPSVGVAMDSLFTQLGVRKAYRQLYAEVPRPGVAQVGTARASSLPDIRRYILISGVVRRRRAGGNGTEYADATRPVPGSVKPTSRGRPILPPHPAARPLERIRTATGHPGAAHPPNRSATDGRIILPPRAERRHVGYLPLCGSTTCVSAPRVCLCIRTKNHPFGR